MCNSYTIKSLLHKPSLNLAAGKDGFFAEHNIFYADSSMCSYLSFFNVHLMHGKIPQECMQTVILPTCKNKNGDTSDAENYKPICLATTKIPNCLNITLCPAFYYLWLATTDNQFGFKPLHAIDVCIFFLKETVSYRA